jgi:hypothetical protein
MAPTTAAIKCGKVAPGRPEESRQYARYSTPGTLPLKERSRTILVLCQSDAELCWQLDVSFREDERRVCRDNAPANLSVIRRFALGLLKRETGCRKGIEIKRIKCAGNDEYREKVLFTC